MSRPNLAELMREAVRKAEEQRDFDNQVARVSRDVMAQLAPHLAETSKSLKCPSCGELLPDGWRPSEVTSDTDNNDDVNEQDNVGTWDNRRRIDHLAKSLVAASNKGSQR